MVLSQLEPSGIQSHAVRDAFLSVPREIFVPETLRGVSYLDDDIPLGQGRFILEPLILARMIESVRLAPENKILDVGAGYGYSSAVLSKLSSHVTALDPDEKMLHAANKHWSGLGINNVLPIVGSLDLGYDQGKFYDVIVLNGATSEKPQVLISQLSLGGRLVCVLRETSCAVGKIVVYTKESDTKILKSFIADAATEYLKGFEPKVKFIF